MVEGIIVVVKFRSIVILSAAIALTACATPVMHNTPSGKAEATFDVPTEVLKPLLVNVMTNAGFAINRDTNYQMAFDKPVTNVMMAALMGSKFNATPDERVTYTFAPLAGQTRVVADVAVVTNPGSGFEQITPMNNNEDSGSVQSMLNNLHQALASKLSADRSLRILLSQQSGAPALVTTVLPGGRAEQSGFKAGDVITQYNGTPVKNAADLIAKAGADRSPDVDYTVIRAGDTMHIKVHFGATPDVPSN